MRNMLTGIGTYTYTWAIGVPGSMPEKPMSVYSLIDKAVTLGVSCVQLADNCPLIDLQKKEWLLIRDYALQRNLSVEIGGRGLTEENLDKYIDLAAFFSSPILRMIIDQGDYKPHPDEVVGIIRNAQGKLASKYMILAIENHDRLPASTFRKIMEIVDSEHAGICLDCANSLGIGEGLDTVSGDLAPFTVNLHVKDFIVKRVSHMMGFVVEGTPAGRGLLNLPALLEKLKPYSRCRSAILELWTPPAGNLAETIEREDLWAKESIDYIKKVNIQS
jgi:sugar phosphate isomerase/epimerase